MIPRRLFCEKATKYIQRLLSESETQSEKDVVTVLSFTIEILLTIIIAVIGKEHTTELLAEILDSAIKGDSSIEVSVVKMRMKDGDKTTAH